MQGFMRGVLAIIGIVALMVVGGIIYATTFFNPNELKPYLIDAFHERTGMTLAIDGNIAWRFYPQFGASIESAKVYGPGQSPAEMPRVSVRHADASFRILPLLSQKLVVSGLNVQGMRVSSNCDLQRQDACMGWVHSLADLLRHSVEQISATRDQAPWLRLVFDMDRVRIDDGELHYLDMSGPSPRRLDINQFSLSGTRVALARIFPLTMRFDLASGATGPMMNVKMAAKALLDPEQQRYELRSVEANASAQEGGNRALLTADSMVVDLKAKRFQSQHNLMKLITLPEWLKGRELPITLDFDMAMDLPSKAWRVDNLHGSSRHLDFNGKLEGSALSDDMSYSGLLSMAQGDIRDWLNENGMPVITSDEEALRSVQFDTAFKGNLHQIQFDVMSGRVDDQPFSGTLLLSQTRELPAHLELRMPSLALDRYLPDSGPAKRESTRGQRDIHTPAWAAWIVAHRAQLFSTSGHIDEVTWRGLPWTNVSWAMNADGERWRLEQLNASLGKGLWTLNGAVYVGRSPMTLYANTTITDMPARAIFNDPELLQGDVDLHAELNAQLSDPVGTVNGPLWFSLQRDTQLGQHVLRPLCQLNDQEAAVPHTLLERLKGRFTVRDGVVYSDALDLALPGLSLKGEGIFDLAHLRFDYHLDSRPDSLRTAQPCGVSQTFAKQGVPLRCAGTLAEASESWCTLDEARAASALSDEFKRKGGLNTPETP